MRWPTQDAPDTADPRDGERWDAVEEVSELLREQRFEEAMVLLKGVLSADGQNAYAFYFLGIALYEAGQLPAARDAYRAAVRVAPRHLGARVALSHVLRATGDLRGAIAEGGVALEQSPTDADALYAVGIAHLARGDDAAARRYLEAFLDAGPEAELAEEVRAALERLGPPS
jgi:tetratricopeptide (TPR) repeat protein